MPCTDPVSSVSGRNSRASNVSGATGASRSVRSPPPSMPPNDTLANAGVLSMLKTSTDTGDIGALSFNSSRLPSMARNAQLRRGHASRPSVYAQYPGPSSNHSYAPSQTSRVSSQWDAASTTQRRGSLTSMQSMPPSLPPVHLSGKPSLQNIPPAPHDHQDSRSYSMTSAPPSQQLPRHRSAISLKSQGREHRHGPRPPPGPVPPMPENRPPFVYPTRLKRPGYRSPSPALSDTYAHGALPGAHSMAGRSPVPAPVGPQLPPQAYNRFNPSNIQGFPQDPRHLNVRPPLRTANSSPDAMGYDPAQYGYRQGPMRNGPTPGMHHAIPIPMQPMMSPPPHPVQLSMGHMPPRAPYPGLQYGPPRPPYAQYSQMPHPGYHGPPSANVAPMAHQMFHNAARMARNLPQRTDTPMTDTGPSSEDPPSSGSAPPSSNPPTPRDQTTIQVVVDPVFINPDLVDLPDSSSEPVLPAKYFDYAEGLEKPIHEPEMVVPHPSVPPSGFVQRVKAMLESKAAIEVTTQHEHDKAARQDQYQDLQVDHDQEEVSELVELHELAGNETPRFTIIEEFEAPVELPASPVRIPELEAIETSQRQSTQRITREMVRAELGPSSTENTQLQPDEGTTHLLIAVDQKQEPDEQQQIRAAEEVSFEVATGSRHLSHRPSEEQDQRDVEDDTIISESVVASLSTGVGYAMRFSAPVDTTVASDETQSRDPFVLDADTTTIRQQQDEDSLSDRPQDVKDSITPETRQNMGHGNKFERYPVSPLRTDEDVNRTSTVSPMHTENTLGIDETLRLASGHRPEAIDLDEITSPEPSQPVESIPPPTPRTPKTYSKSVQLHPSATISDSTSTGTNRFSLPGDLSTIGDTTINSVSEMVTDVAVRFSLPQTTITIGKPQIVDVSTSSTPDKPKQELGLPHQGLNHADLKSSRRNSVTFADEIAPLNISKKTEQYRTVQAPEASSIKSRFIIRRRDEPTEPTHHPRDTAIDLRFSTTNELNGIGNRFGSSYLPGLKEESIEDMSITEDRRSSGGHLPFSLPARIAAVKVMQERRLQESADKAKARRHTRHHNRPLADTRDLPSLNFSRMDLIDRLNEELEVRTAKSIDVIRRPDFLAIHSPSPQRPQSTEPLRERYMSFFSKPEEFSFFNGHETEDEEEYHPGIEKALVPTFQIQEQTEIEGVEPEKRPLSPEDFLNVASQVQRLSIPTVNTLSDRLSELIPGLRNLSNLELDHFFVSERENLRRSMEFARPDTVLTNHTSAGFRTLAERAEEFVKNGTHDSIGPPAKVNKELPPLPESASVDMISGATSTEGKQSYLSGSVSAPTELGKDPAHPTSALLRVTAPTTEEEVQQMLPKEMNPITRNAKRSTIISQSSNRPWNQAENYPWSSKVDIDLTVPSQARTRNSFASEVLRERGTKSLDLTQPVEPTEPSKGIDIGSITTVHLERSTSVTTEQATGFSPQHTRRTSKRSIIGSISRKFGLSSSKAAATDDDTSKSLPRSPLPRRCSTHQSHKPGDRYPTSGLTPPAGFNLDEVRSFFSDNSSEKDGTGSFRKRLTQFKGSKGKAPRPDQAHSHSFDRNTAYDAGSLLDARVGADSRAHTYEGVGMSKTEFHIKRFGEKLRHLFARGGDLIRSLSTRGNKVKRQGGPSHDEWLADSLYSGV